MIDWKRRAMQLIQNIQDADFVRAIYLAAGLRQLDDLERKCQKKFMEYWRCSDKKQSQKIYEDYLGLVRLTNETAEQLDQEGFDNG